MANAKRRPRRPKADDESSGFFGWLASKAKAFFNKIKAGIKAAFDWARKKVKEAIEWAKKKALEAIEAARKWIVDKIRAVGDFLIALGDTLLAAFPGLRDKWRNFIKEKVAAAEAAVNKYAEQLKKDVVAALDALGAALDAALGLLEKGLLAAVDAVAAVVDGAIKAAKAIADAIGTFIVLIKDIAANPGQWISNLGAAVVDGIKNHLWTAFQTAVKQWFNEKVEEVIGLGTTIWGILTKGGITLAQVGGMVWEGIKSAIPGALVQILVEKLVSMIVPAAGAVMAIIEGLQAAWGTIQRILAAISRFIAFLKAVKTGNAGPQFAQALAAAAIAVIDFVANWLLKRLRGPASKVGGKIKAIAQRILQKIKKVAKKVVAKVKKVAKKLAKKLKDIGRKLKGKFKKFISKFKKKKGKGKGKKGKDKQKDKKKSAEDKKKERLDKAVEAIKPQLQKTLSKGISMTLLKAKLLYWRVRYRLSSLTISPTGQINASINPKVTLPSGKVVTEAYLGQLLQPIFAKAESEYEDELMAQPDVKQQHDEAAAKFAAGDPKALEGLPRDLQQKIVRDVRVIPAPGVKKPTVEVTEGVTLGVDPGGKLSKLEVKMGSMGAYPKILENLQSKVTEYGLDPRSVESILGGRPDAIEGKLGSLSGQMDAGLLSQRGGKPLTQEQIAKRDAFLDTLRRTAFLTQTVEPARHGGIATSAIVAGSLVEKGTIIDGKKLGMDDLLGRGDQKDPGGQVAPMTPQKVLGNPEQAKSKKEKEAIEGAQHKRDTRIGHIFSILMNEARHGKIVTSEGGGDLGPLVAALTNFLEQHFAHKKDPKALRNSLTALKAQVKAMLARYNGR